MAAVEPAKTMDIMAQIPVEVARDILRYMECEELAAVCRVSKRWRRLANHNQLWKRHYLQSGYCIAFSSGVAPPPPPPPPHAAKNSTPDKLCDLERQCKWYYRFSKKRRLRNNWKRGIFRIKDIEGIFGKSHFMRDGAITVLECDNSLKLYSTDDQDDVDVDDRPYQRIDTSEGTVIGFSNTTFVIRDRADSAYLCYTCRKKKFFPVLTGRILVEDEANAKCVGILEDTVCMAVDSALHFLSVRRKKVVRDVDFMETAEFTILKDSLFVHDQKTILEFDAFGSKRSEINSEGDIFRHVSLFANESILLAESRLPRDQVWISSQMLTVWDRRNAKRICRLSEEVEALTLHPRHPMFFYFPKFFECEIRVICYDARTHSARWFSFPFYPLETMCILPFLSMAGEDYVVCIVHKFSASSGLVPYDSGHFLIDAWTGDTLDCKRISECYVFLRSDGEHVAFVSHLGNRYKRKVLRVLSYG